MPGSAELFATMAVIAAGALLGRIQFRGVRLEVTAMLLFGALVAHFGITLSPALGLFGLLLFLYTVGVQTGPALRTMRRRELRLAGLGIAILLAMLAAVVGAGTLLDIPISASLGTFAGFFGSGAALAVLEGDAAGTGASAGFAIAAPLSSLVVMVLVQVWRVAARKGIEGEINAWNAVMSRQHDRSETIEIEIEQPGCTDVPMRRLQIEAQVLWVRRNGVSMPVNGDTVLRLGDVVRLACPAKACEALTERLGRLVPVAPSRGDDPVVVRKFFVSNADAIDVRLETLALRERFGATVTRIRRAGVNLMPRAGFRFRWGDRIQVSLRADKVEELRRLLGDDIHGLDEFAFPRAALVIFVGGLVGSIPLQLGGSESVRLGPALGVLIASLVTAALHRTGPMVWSQSGPTSSLMAHIALPLFMAEIGNASYAGLMTSWGDYGLALVLLALLPVVLIALLALAAGRLLGYGPLTVLSLIPSIALNTPALTAVQKAYREVIPGHVYAAVYPFVALSLLLSMFLLTLVI